MSSQFRVQEEPPPDLPLKGRNESLSPALSSREGALQEFKGLRFIFRYFDKFLVRVAIEVSRNCYRPLSELDLTAEAVRYFDKTTSTRPVFLFVLVLPAALIGQLHQFLKSFQSFNRHFAMSEVLDVMPEPIAHISLFGNEL